VAVQWEQAGDGVAAAPWFLRAAREAAERCAQEEASEIARRGQADGVDLALRIDLLLEEISALWIAGRLVEHREVMERRVPWDQLVRGSDAWVTLRSFQIASAAYLQNKETFQQGLALFLSLERPPPLTRAWSRAVTLGVSALTHTGVLGPAQRLLDVAWAAEPPPDHPELGHLEWSRSLLGIYTDDPQAWAWARRSTEHMMRVAHPDRFAIAGIGAIVLLDFGLFDEVAAIAPSARAAARRRHEEWYHDWALVAEIGALALRPDPRPCEALLDEMLTTSDVILSGRATVWARIGKARIHRDDPGVLAAVAAELEAMVEPFRAIVSVSGSVLAALAEVALLRGRPAESLAWATRGLEQLPALTITPRTSLQLAAARSLAALGRAEEAARRRAEGRARVLSLAARIEDEAVRRAFLAHPASAAMLGDER
jgi:hypothetical protein